jgi:hypothetical protein
VIGLKNGVGRLSKPWQRFTPKGFVIGLLGDLLKDGVGINNQDNIYI